MFELRSWCCGDGSGIEGFVIQLGGADAAAIFEFNNDAQAIGFAGNAKDEWEARNDIG